MADVYDESDSLELDDELEGEAAFELASAEPPPALLPPPPLPPLLPLSQLAMPRGQALLDELSGKPASLQLRLCGLTFNYATRDSAALDFATLVHLAPLLAARDAEEGAEGSTSERATHAARARTLTERIARVAGELASIHIAAGACDVANPAALRYLRALRTLHGEGSPAVLPGLLVLAEAALGMGVSRAAQASEFLFTASFSTHQTERSGGTPATSAMLARLQRNYGRLYTLQGKLPEAVDAYAAAIVHASRCSGGPEGFATSRCYYGLGTAFLAQHEEALRAAGGATEEGDDGMGGYAKLDAVFACFNKVVEAHVAHAAGGGGAHLEAEAPAAPGDLAGAPPSAPGFLSPAELSAADMMLSHIAAVRAEHCGGMFASGAQAALSALAAVKALPTPSGAELADLTLSVEDVLLHHAAAL